MLRWVGGDFEMGIEGDHSKIQRKLSQNLFWKIKYFELFLKIYNSHKLSKKDQIAKVDTGKIDAASMTYMQS